MIPLMKLESFAGQITNPKSIFRLIKMDTEGSEIDILKSGLSLFASGRVNAFVVELGVRHWVENKKTTLDEGVAILNMIWKSFDDVVSNE